MEITHKKVGDLLIVKPNIKALDSTNSSIFKGKMMDLLEDGANNALIDMKDVEFLDSSGLGSLISMNRILSAGAGIALCHVKPQVLSTLQLTRMDSIFHIYGTEDEAIAELVK